MKGLVDQGTVAFFHSLEEEVDGGHYFLILLRVEGEREEDEGECEFHRKKVDGK